jgi:hypothetical protein
MITVILLLHVHAASYKIHDWYPKECCEGQDCRPVSCTEITEEPDFYVWHNLRFQKHGKLPKVVRPSPDDHCHVCAIPPNPYCIFLPQWNS